MSAQTSEASSPLKRSFHFPEQPRRQGSSSRFARLSPAVAPELLSPQIALDRTAHHPLLLASRKAALWSHRRQDEYAQRSGGRRACATGTGIDLNSFVHTDRSISCLIYICCPSIVIQSQAIRHSRPSLGIFWKPLRSCAKCNRCNGNSLKLLKMEPSCSHGNHST